MRNKVLVSMTVVGLFFAFAIVEATAQTTGRVEAKIPFDFAAGKAKLKAGVYSVKRLSDRTLKLSSTDGNVDVVVNAPLSVDSRNSADVQRLVFNRYGDEFFLSQVWLRVDSGQQLFPTGEEMKKAEESKRSGAEDSRKRVEIALHR